MEKFFCPAPWRTIFYHVDKVAVCCTSSKKFKMTPKEFLESEYLKNLKEKFLKGEYDDTCSSCKRLEDSGLQSIRQHFIERYGENTTTFLDYMELRTSNLCNFQCKMCRSENSSLIAGEVFNISDKNFEEILYLSKNLKTLILTGGEPMLIKHYYVLLDYLISLNKNDLVLKIYTNGSVYNPIFIEKILNFKSKLCLSIDGVGSTAENQRMGTNWSIVNENIFKFLKLPINIAFHTTLTNISLKDVHSLAKYFSDISAEYSNCDFMVHTASKPDHISIFNTPKNEIPITIESIDRALEILTSPKFKQFKNQLLSHKRMLTDKLSI